jgi:hypothetical protein
MFIITIRKRHPWNLCVGGLLRIVVERDIRSAARNRTPVAQPVAGNCSDGAITGIYKAFYVFFSMYV